MNVTNSMVSSTAERIGEAANEFFAAISRGEEPSIAEFSERYPEIAEHIRRAFPALLLVGNCSTDQDCHYHQSSENGFKILGDFRLIGEIGRGGMGTVFEAEQISMGRRVALKVLPFAALVHQSSLQRFRNEVRAAAALNHPHIVPVYSIGEERGVHFYAMQLIRGRTLADMIAQLGGTRRDRSPKPVGTGRTPASDRSNFQPPPTSHIAQGQISTEADSRQPLKHFQSAARLGIQAAEALQHAHDLGVLHRDIKPSNLLLDAEGKLYVTDFGLARIEADAGMTMTGDIVGTLRYMAPEQALAKRVVIDNRADIYSLGATLYELLTLEPAFSETDRSELLKQIAFGEPRPLRRIDRRIPAELETIVLKAMAKNTEERYQSAHDLADELRAFLEHRPIKAQPPTIANHITKWSRRHHVLVRTASVVLALSSILLAAGIVIVKRAQTQAVAALNETSDLLYTADMAVAYQNLEKGWMDEVQPILDRYRPKAGEPDRRGLEWHLLRKMVQPPASITLAGHKGPVNELAVFPDHRRVASVGQDGTLRIWDSRAGALLRRIEVCKDPLFSVAISPDGRFVAAGNSVVYLCDLEHEGQVCALYSTDANVESLTFTPDGNHLVAGERYDGISLLSVQSKMDRRVACAMWLSFPNFLPLPGDHVEQRVPCASRVESLEFVAGTSQLLVPNRRFVDKQVEGFVQLYDIGLKTVVQNLDTSNNNRPGRIRIAHSSPCGNLVLVGGGNADRACIVERVTGRLLTETPVARDKVTDVAYSPDGKAIAIGYRNGRMEYYKLELDSVGNPTNSRRLLMVDAHQGEVTGIRFVDSRTLVTCGVDELVRIWKIPTETGESFARNDSKLDSLILSPDGSHLLYVCEHEFLIADMENGDVQYRLSNPQETYAEAAWSPAGDRMAVCCRTSERVVLLDRHGREVKSIRTGFQNRPSAVAFSPDGTLIAVIDTEMLQLCRSDNGQVVVRKPLRDNGIAVTFSHNGEQLAYNCRGGGVFVLNLVAPHDLRELPCSSNVACLVFSPDNTQLATGHDDSVIRLWDLSSGRVRGELTGHERAPLDLAFSSDGRTLLSAGGDGSVRLWSVEHCRSYGVLCRDVKPDFYGSACRLSLSADGRRLAVGYGTKRDDHPDILLWNLDLDDRN